MEYRFKNKLKKKAQEFILKCTKNGITGKIINNSFREYSIKVAILDMGNVNIYYSPNKNSYTLSCVELKDKSIVPVLERCFYPELEPISAEDTYQAYVDGSFVDGKPRYGVIILKKGVKIAEFSGIVKNKTAKDICQVAGEIFAAKKVIQWCRKNKINSIEIFYDYDGVKNWATGEWKAKNQMTLSYANFMKKSDIKIKWNKVKSHSGVFWNEMVNKLAKGKSEK